MYENTLNDSTDTVNYKAYVSGYDINDEGYPTLDSIQVHTSHRTVFTTQTITIEKIKAQKQRKWVITPNIGYGYGLTNKQPDIYIGIGIGYRLY